MTKKNDLGEIVIQRQENGMWRAYTTVPELLNDGQCVSGQKVTAFVEGRGMGPTEALDALYVAVGRACLTSTLMSPW